MNNLATIESPQRFTVPELRAMAEAMVASRFYGFTVEQAITLMLVAQSEGMHPAQAAREYNIIQGRAALSGEAMLARLQRRGGHVQWHSYSPAEVSATFTGGNGDSIQVTWTMERARSAGLAGKDNWRKYPEAMLANRCISEGVRRVDPGAILGHYTPEETESFTVVDSAPDDAEYMDAEERRALRARVDAEQASAPPRDREPASEAVKQVAAERTAAAKAAVADASGDTRKDVKLTMTGGGTTYTGDGGEKPCVVFKALHGSKEFTLRHYNPITFGERVAAAGDPENKLTPHKHEGPIIADLTAAPDGNGGYIYTCSNLRIVPAVAEVPAPELGEPISEDELAAMTAKGKK